MTDGSSTMRKGPRVRVDLSCNGCCYERTRSYAVQGDSGTNVYCAHPTFTTSRSVGDTTWTTPPWCPEREASLTAAGLSSDAVLQERDDALKALGLALSIETPTIEAARAWIQDSEERHGEE